jgi:Holliday junction DNA helicase RuvB
VGVANLAVAVGEEADTVETVAEPFLVREGFVVRTPRGRAATPAAWAHLGLAAPAGGTAYLASMLPLEEAGEADAGGRFGG